ncbi:MAG: radical SAM family heme chaperone HemW [Saprospiraceae bacterium]
MAGIYIHIPFCKQACHYCNFHFSTSLKYKDELLAALVKEIGLRADYIQTPVLNSIYFGGGTPSLLSEKDINFIFEELAKHYSWKKSTEITMEANPDDLSLSYLEMLSKAPINRLSIGVQSFFNEDLLFMNRAHNASESQKCIADAQNVGIDNLSIDLIYGTPTTSNMQWEDNVQKVIDFNVSHVSAYCLTVEEKTALHHFVKTGKVKPVDEEKAAFQYNQLIEMLENDDFEHYEISNFAKNGKYAIHNSSYWKGDVYLGFGPGAHSFDGASTRSWNIANNANYIKSISSGYLPLEKEVLTNSELYNEYILIGMRTVWGVDIKLIRERFPEFENHFLRLIEAFCINGFVSSADGKYVVTQSGKLIADRIASELFVV